ncbi:MAG: ribonuclease HIII [Planctomycetota bacterium]
MHVQVIPEAVAERIRAQLEQDGFRLGSAPYATFEAVGSDVRVTYYPKKQKLLLQGNGTGGLLVRLSELLGPPPEDRSEPADHQIEETTIGSDESGKGDYFGSLVVAGCRVEPKDLPWIEKMGVKDSKLASRHAILMLEGRILDRLETAVVELEPVEYGRRHEETGNVNRILGEAHARVIRELRKSGGCNRAVVDRFGGEHLVRDALGRAGKNLTLIQIPRAEANPAVACASFIARARFLRSLERLSDEVGVDLLPGASREVEDCARKVAAVGGRELLARVAKMHFKTTQRVLQ